MLVSEPFILFSLCTWAFVLSSAPLHLFLHHSLLLFVQHLVLGVDLACSQMHWDLALWCIWDDLLELQVVKDAFVQRPLGGAAVPELLIVVVEALPVIAKLR